MIDSGFAQANATKAYQFDDLTGEKSSSNCRVWSHEPFHPVLEQTLGCLLAVLGIKSCTHLTSSLFCVHCQE